MTTIRKMSEVRGSVFDLPKSQTLSDDDCNVLLVSSRTLYFIQTFATGEVDFLARYASSFLDGAKFVLADSATDLNQINDIGNRYEIEVQPMTCDIVTELQNITVAIQQLATAGCGSCGSEVDPESEETPPVGPGTPWPDFPTYDVYKCRGANWLLDGMVDIFQKLLIYDVDFWTTTTVSAGAGLVTSIILTTILGGWIVVVAGVVIALVTALIVGTTIDLTDIKNALISASSDLICALYNGNDADGSTAAFQAVLVTEGLNAAEVALVGLVMANSLVNNLYEFNAAVNTHPITIECNCGGGDPCPFFFNAGSGSPTYDGNSFVLSSEDVGAYHSINLSSLWSDVGCTGGNWCVEFISTTIDIPTTTWARLLWCWDSPTTLKTINYNPNFPPLLTELTIMALEMNSVAGPFTITMKVVGTSGLCVTGPGEGCT